MNRVFVTKAKNTLLRTIDARIGAFYPLDRTLERMVLRPFELQLELTNLCNADCVFCPYQFQQREIRYMSDEVFEKAVADFVACGGGSVGMTPIVGDALIDPKFLERVRSLRSLSKIDRIWLITNGILLDHCGIDAVLDSGLTSITISTAGFDEAMYRRVYRSSSYQRMRRNVVELVTKNAARAEPLPITIALRPDRPLDDVLADPDFQPILKLGPQIDFSWAFASIGGLIPPGSLPSAMKLRVVSSKPEACVNTYHGAMVLADGTVLGCGCVAAMDAQPDLVIGNVLRESLLDIWHGEAARRLRESFTDGSLNPTCAKCDVYRNLDLYRSSEGRRRASLNELRAAGRDMHRPDKPTEPFPGG